MYFEPLRGSICRFAVAAGPGVGIDPGATAREANASAVSYFVSRIYLTGPCSKVKHAMARRYC